MVESLQVDRSKSYFCVVCGDLGRRRRLQRKGRRVTSTKERVQLGTPLKQTDRGAHRSISAPGGMGTLSRDSRFRKTPTLRGDTHGAAEGNANSKGEEKGQKAPECSALYQRSQGVPGKWPRNLTNHQEKQLCPHPGEMRSHRQSSSKGKAPSSLPKVVADGTAQRQVLGQPCESKDHNERC